ncbi:hypothetical protein CKM354_000806800 [Cercospora kikuchii]|uniref:Uncharacterized protein n=1 Tax=Cercospora kikuchii TaxID=84275 RepID=A0A9P3FI13_9PEZI|nr:uncharacterized protein CKM354_000806800 [Cercospora kikuchii]GIZ44882.1 hypothetical protein CKM354_000806800 [Cercospora kikuchii]
MHRVAVFKRILKCESFSWYLHKYEHETVSDEEDHEYLSQLDDKEDFSHGDQVMSDEPTGEEGNFVDEAAERHESVQRETTLGLPVTLQPNHHHYILDEIENPDWMNRFLVQYSRWPNSLPDASFSRPITDDISRPCLIETNILTTHLLSHANATLTHKAPYFATLPDETPVFQTLITTTFDILLLLEGQNFESPDALYFHFAELLCKELSQRSPAFEIFVTAERELVETLPEQMSFTQECVWFVISEVVGEAERIREFMDTVHWE